MALDPTLLTSIPGHMADIPAAAAKGFQLKDIMNQEQLGQMQLNQQQAAMQEDKAIKDVLSKSELSTYEGQQKAAEAVQKINPSKGMEMLKQFQSAQMGQAKLTEEQLILLNAKNDMIGAAVVGLKEQHDNLIQSGVSDQMAMTMMQPLYQRSIQDLANLKMPNGKSPFDQNDLKWIQQNPQYNPQLIDKLVQQSGQAREMLKQHWDRQNQQSEIQRRQDQTAVDKKRVDVQQRTEGLNEKKFAAGQADSMEAETVDAMAEQYLAGDKSVLQNIGRGAQGAKNIVKIRKRIYELGQEQGMSPRDIAAKVAEFSGTVAGERTLGTRTANIGMAVNEADKLSNLALTASKNLPRGKFVPLNQAMQYVKSKTGSPEYARFVAANNSFINVYARALSPSGVPTVSDKDRAHEMLNTAMTREQYEAVIDQLKQEMSAAKAAPGEVRQEFKGAVTGETPKTGSSSIDDLLKKYGGP